MGQLTTAMIAALCGFRQETIDAFTADLSSGENVDALSADGACSLVREVTELSVTGTDAYTLAAPTRPNQRKIVRCVLAASTPLATLTITSPDDTTGYVCAAKFLFNTVGQEIELRATAALKWRCIRKVRVGSKTLVLGTTDTTDICNMEALILTSTTGTVASLTTKGIPNGSAIGEEIQIAASVAGGTPHGDIAIAAVNELGVAKTALDDFTVVGEGGRFKWNGTAWALQGRLTSTTLAFT